MFNYKDVKFHYEPYPICHISNVLSPSDYAELMQTYPATDAFLNHQHKYSLAELHNRANYDAHVAKHPKWREFHAYIKSRAFVDGVLDMLAQHNIDLNLGTWRLVPSNGGTPRQTIGARMIRRTELSSRFEFSMMRPDGGHIRPHTDASTKIITLVLSMIGDEWNQSWGGGTEVCLPKDRTKIFNTVNRYMEFDETEHVRTFEFRPNHCVLFIKTYNSWHQVSPIQGPAGGPMRRNITINIEKAI